MVLTSLQVREELESYLAERTMGLADRFDEALQSLQFAPDRLERVVDGVAGEEAVALELLRAIDDTVPVRARDMLDQIVMNLAARLDRAICLRAGSARSMRECSIGSWTGAVLEEALVGLATGVEEGGSLELELGAQRVDDVELCVRLTSWSAAEASPLMAGLLRCLGGTWPGPSSEQAIRLQLPLG